jgi:O-antigen/teichoic acid export membrane protein
MPAQGGDPVRKRELAKDVLVLLLFLVISLAFFSRQTIGGKTMLPADNVFGVEPWASYTVEAETDVPHNDLLSDLYLQNYAWKRFILNSIRGRQLPLWNPYIFTGMPFLATGQHSAMYPLSVLFYVLPLSIAYGWFAAVHMFLAGTSMYILARTFRVGRLGASVGGVAFMLSGFMVTRQVFPMIIAAAVWLPLILAIIEKLANKAETGESNLVSYLPYALIGSVAIALVFLAGHPEMYYYTTLVCGSFALYRLVRVLFTTKRARTLGSLVLVMGGMVLLGAGLGFAQWGPLLEVVQHNFREGSTSFEEVLSWAWPWRRVFSMFVPDFFGNPSHHTYFDLYQWRTVAITENYFGDPITNPNWGMKNYVEGTGYLGFAASMLVIVTLLRRKGRHLGFLTVLSVLSIMFVFGSPLYIIIYKLPGLNQVHSPFRWIFPFTLCTTLMAGMGADLLWRDRHLEPRRSVWGLLDRFAHRVLPWLIVAAALGGILAMAGTLVLKDRMIPLADRAIEDLAKAPYGIAGPEMFYSYMFRHFVILAGAMLVAGVVLLLHRKLRDGRIWAGLVVLAIAAEAFVISWDFYPAVDPELIGYRTPVIDFLAEDTETYRITAYTPSGGRPLIANSPWFYDIQDIRGYDSIIPSQYVGFMQLLQGQHDLLYNRIGPITQAHALRSPLLDILNVKYVVTDLKDEIRAEGYTLVYENEVKVYRNDDYMPRAYLVANATFQENEAKRRVALRSFDPRTEVHLEIPPPLPDQEVPADFGEVESLRYGANEITVLVDTPIPAYLILNDAWFPGWRAFVRPADAEDPLDAEQEVEILRANENFRAVVVAEGRHVVRLKYSPNIVKLGLYVSFISTVVLVLLLALWGWLRFFRVTQDEEAAQRVTKNTVAPIALNLVNRVIDMAFAMLMLRLLGPIDASEYYYAVLLISWLDILTNFGLNTLITREVAKNKADANRYLNNGIAVRFLLWIGAIVALAMFLWLQTLVAPVRPTTVLAIALFAIALIPSNISATISAVFQGHERMAVPAAIATFTTLLKVTFGAGVLVLGFGYVGLASVSIGVNVVTMLALYGLLRRWLFQPHIDLAFRFQKEMLRISYPLMLNNLLATLFFKVAIVLLKWRVPDPRVVGWYSTAYKYIDAVGVIPAYFTMAVFPLMSRYAAESHEGLMRAYQFAMKLLLAVALPGALIGSAFARELILLLGGNAYAQATPLLAVMIWYMPFGFLNSVTQYVLIALDKRSFLTVAFAIGLAFNVLANLVLIDIMGYQASSYVMVASELALLIPFAVGVHRHLAPVPWARLAWKIVLCAAPTALLLAALPHHYRIAGALVGLGIFAVGMWKLEAFTEDERDTLRKALPLKLLRTQVQGWLPSTPT